MHVSDTFRSVSSCYTFFVSPSFFCVLSFLFSSCFFFRTSCSIPYRCYLSRRARSSKCMYYYRVKVGDLGGFSVLLFFLFFLPPSFFLFFIPSFFFFLRLFCFIFFFLSRTSLPHQFLTIETIVESLRFLQQRGDIVRVS